MDFFHVPKTKAFSRHLTPRTFFLNDQKKFLKWVLEKNTQCGMRWPIWGYVGFESGQSNCLLFFGGFFSLRPSSNSVIST